jgi:hypothetical protein
MDRFTHKLMCLAVDCHVQGHIQFMRSSNYPSSQPSDLKYVDDEPQIPC